MAMLALGTGNVIQAEPSSAKTASVVRTDVTTGRLVRTVVVSPKRTPARPEAEPERKIEPKPAEVPLPEASRSAGGGPIDIDTIVLDAAQRHDVDPLLVHSVIKVESNYNPNALSNKGAQGLMQLIPSTARRFGVSNAFNARENIEAGVKYLRYLKDMFQDDRLALAAYNAGEGAVLKYGDIPPYSETQQYVYKVGKRYGEARRRSPQPAVAKSAAPDPQTSVPPAPAFNRVEVYTDADGKIYLRTRE
jgi:soluble lytic murein transglycosylase-like protein